MTIALVILAAATTASPMPKVFPAVQGLEPLGGADLGDLPRVFTPGRAAAPAGGTR